MFVSTANVKQCVRKRKLRHVFIGREKRFSDHYIGVDDELEFRLIHFIQFIIYYFDWN